MNFIFDLYGTLIDIWTDEASKELWSWLAYRCNYESSEAAYTEYIAACNAKKRKPFHEIDLSDVFSEMLEHSKKNCRDSGKSCPQKSKSIQKTEALQLAREFRRHSMISFGIFPHVHDILQGLRERGAKLFLLSNAQACFTKNELEECKLTQYFDGIILSSEVGKKKPYPEIFRLAFEKFNITPEDSIYVGNDMRDDVTGAANVGMKTVYIETRQSSHYPLPHPEPDYTADTHAELMYILFSIADEKLTKA